MLRLYSEQDIAKLRMIKHLVEEVRLNLAGVEMALAVFDRMVAARERMERTAAMNRAFEQMMDDILTLFAGR
jgi:DNA-binding transcriptional MerR regulator